MTGSVHDAEFWKSGYGCFRPNVHAIPDLPEAVSGPYTLYIETQIFSTRPLRLHPSDPALTFALVVEKTSSDERYPFVIVP